MHRFRPDDSAVLFLDCFGLTRLELPKKVKTDRKIRGGWEGLMGLSDAGDQALVYDADFWRTYAYSFPAFKPSHRYKRFEWREALLLADGDHMLVNNVVRTLDGRETGRLDTTPTRILAPLTVGEPRDLGYYIHDACVPQVCSQGVFATVEAPDWNWELNYGTCHSDGGKVTWRRPLHHHGGHRHNLFPHTGGLVITTLAPREAKVHALWLDPNGNEVARFDGTGSTVPVWAFGRLAWQVDQDTVVVRTDEGECTTFSITAATRQAHAVKKHPRALPKGDFLGDLPNTGIGEVLLGPGNLLLVPWHCETILDLNNGVEIHRKLPADEHLPRRAFRQRARRAAAVARSADMTLDAGFCELKKRYQSFSVGFSMTRGAGGIIGLCASGAVARLMHDAYADAAPWRCDGGSGGSSDYLSGTYGVDDLFEVFRIFDEHRVHLHWSWDPLSNAYERRLGGTSTHYGEVMGPVLTKEAEKLLIHALLESAEAAPPYGMDGPLEAPFRLLDRVPTWRASPLTREMFLERAVKARHAMADDNFTDYLARSYFDGHPAAA